MHDVSRVIHNPWLVAARRLRWKKEPWLEAQYFGVMLALDQIVRDEAESSECRAEAESLIKELYRPGKAPRSYVLDRDS